MEEKEINLGYLKKDKESIAQLEDIINSAGSGVFSIFIEDPRDVEFRGVEGDTLVSVYVKGKFSRYITDEQRREITDYQENKESENVILAEIQPQSYDSDVMVVKVKRGDLE